MTNKEIAIQGEIIRIVAGSKLYGIDTPESDIDILGVCIEPPKYVVGLHTFEQWDGPELNGTIYSLRKFIRLVTNGNPTVTELLFVPESHIIESHQYGRDLLALASKLVSQKTIHCYLGYLKAQKERLIGERGQKRSTRAELEEKFGYDTKYAAHALRLGMLGNELARCGNLRFPMCEADRQHLLALRNGKYSLKRVVEEIEHYEMNLEFCKCNLTVKPDMDYINRWLITTYTRYWNNHDFLSL